MFSIRRGKCPHPPSLAIEQNYRRRTFRLSPASLPPPLPRAPHSPENRDFFEELSKFGRLEALHVCDNLGDHMIGHVYAKFAEEEEAADALNVMNGRYYDGRKLEAEFSPVTDFREARCRDFDEDTCRRGGFCNFMHIKPVPLCLIRDMEDEAEDGRRREEAERAERRRRGERRDRSGGGGGGGGGGGSDHRRGGGRRDRERKGGSSRRGSRSRSRSGTGDEGGP